MARLKPFRALRYDTRRAGPLGSLVAPPHDVIEAGFGDRLLAASPYNAVRLVRPTDPTAAARALAEWCREGVLVRDTTPAVWLLREDFVGPDGRSRSRRSVVARIRLEPYASGAVLPHERTAPRQKETRLELLRAVRTKLSPILLLHEGDPPQEPAGQAPDADVEFGGVRSRLWRVDDAEAIEGTLAAVRGQVIIADGHHRYETALRFHEEEGSEETAYVLAALVSRADPGLVILPTHRVVSGPAPEPDGRFHVTSLAGGAEEALSRLGGVPRDRPAFVMLEASGALLAEAAPEPRPVAVLDTAAIAELGLGDVSFTPSAEAAERAVRSGRATAAFLVRAPTIEQVEAVAVAGETMPEKTTYFFPKLTSGLLLSPFDE